ncbi:hypothetical protein [Clostridium sp. CF012]|uniref:hypothetical protein n=1 Tax=Clostridium sp. CF012 TaxID=2843319 RepID=UPI001C0C6673|nr:hypothetical protein [Clostridium sp. CF012]MBU3146672.1 hypothetical protein [Clostridium sp. CF012]
MNKKLIISIGILSGLLVLVFGLIKFVVADINGELKAPQVVKITNEYLDKVYPKEKCKIIDGPHRSLSFGTYGVKVRNQDNLIFNITIRDNLRFLEDSRAEDYLNNELNNFLQNEYKGKFQKMKVKILANVVINSKYLDREDTVYVDIIDTGDITKQEFAKIVVQALNWINTKDLKLNILYLDYMHRENSDNVYSIKIDSNNYNEKDLITYIINRTTVGKK